MTEQHAVGRGERQCIAGAFFPGQVTRARHQLTVLHTTELCEGTVRCFIAPDTLAVGEHRIAAVAFLVVAVILVAVDNNFVADFPAFDLAAHGINHARSVRTGNVIGLFVDVKHRHRRAQRSPDTVVVHARRHHQNQHIMAVQFGGFHDLDLHGLVRRTLTFLADCPSIHLFRHMAQRRNFTDLVQVLLLALGQV